jgi:hypothetical protein
MGAVLEDEQRIEAVPEVKDARSEARGLQDRSKIHMQEACEVKYWARELGVSREELQKPVDRVGNSAAAVCKELAV